MLCEEELESTHDENERYAMLAIMTAAASRGKGKNGRIPSIKDLYPRDKEVKSEEKKEEDIREQYEHTKEWLAQFDLDSIDKNAKEKEYDIEKGGN